MITKIVLSVLISGTLVHTVEDSTRESKQLIPGLFSIVKFPNDQCSGSNTGFVGNCITASECNSRSGQIDGTCARGFGTCCVLTDSSGSYSVKYNNTYLLNPNHPSALSKAYTYTYTLNRLSSDICFIRLDFHKFYIASPQQNSETPYTSCNPCHGWKCSVDYVTFSTPTMNVPKICGNLDGQHMYIDSSSSSANTMNFVGTGSSYNRYWNIRVSQIPCGTLYTPPVGCLQYHTGISGEVYSFNYGKSSTDGHHLISQEYSICFRRERGYCTMSYFPTSTGGFFTTGDPANGALARAGQSRCKKDYITIVQGRAGQLGTCKTPSGSVSNVQRFCGNRLNCADKATVDSVVYSTALPFRIGVFFTSTEPGGPTAETNGNGNNLNRGFGLKYNQILCGTVV